MTPLTALASLNGVATSADDIEVEIADAEETVWWVKSQRGVIRIGLGRGARPDLMIRANGSSLAELWRRQTYSDVDVPVVRTVGSGWSPMFPFGVRPQSTEVVLSSIQELIVQHVNHEAPFGTVRYFDVFHSGTLSARHGGLAKRPDVIIDNSFRKMMRSLVQDASLIDEIDGARVGSRSPFCAMQAAAIYESNEFRRHLLPDNHLAEKLITFAELVQHPLWKEAFR